MGLDLGIRDGLSAQELSRQMKQFLKYPDKLFRRVRDKHIGRNNGVISGGT